MSSLKKNLQGNKIDIILLQQTKLKIKYDQDTCDF